MPNFCIVADEMFIFLESQGVCIDDDLRESAIEVIQRRYPAERAHITPTDSPKQARRKAKIIEAAKLLPVSVVAERYGVTRQWVSKATKK